MTKREASAAMSRIFVASTQESPARAPEEPETMDVREIQPSGGASIVVGDLGHHMEGLDAVAGSEFLDDRIRLRE